MIPPPDPLPDDLAAALAAAKPQVEPFGTPLLYFSTVGSTNDIASALAGRTPCEGALVVADSQTAGRGRRGHTWFSPPGSGLYVSVVLAPATAVTDTARATTLLTLEIGR